MSNVSEDAADRINAVIEASNGPFETRGRWAREHGYKDSKWMSALSSMPSLTRHERAVLVAYLTRTRSFTTHQISFNYSILFTTLAGYAATLYLAEGLAIRLVATVITGLISYVLTTTGTKLEPKVAHIDGLLAALAEIDPKEDEAPGGLSAG